MIIATSTPKGFKLGAEIIKWYQGTEFSHVLILEEDLVYQASHGFVNCWHIEVFMEQNNMITVYEIPDSAVDMEYVKSQLGRKYSVMQILKIAVYALTHFKFKKDNGNKSFICSELVGKALRLPWVNDYTTPEEIDDYLKEIARRK